MSTSKRSATGASTLNTGRFTSPIIIKLAFAFAVMTLLGLIVVLFALVNLNQSNDSIKNALELQENANRASEMRVLLVDQQQAAEAALFEGQPQERFDQIKDRLARQLNFSMLGTKLDLIDLSYKQYQFINLFQQFASQPPEARLQNRRELEPQLQTLTQQMVTMTDNYYGQFWRETQSTLTSLNRRQQDAVLTMVVLSLLAVVVAAVTSWFVVYAVILPLRRMNEQLAQLLWSQNEHLMAQLNLLRQEVNTHSEMLTAVRHDLKAPWGNVKSLAQLSVITHPDLPAPVQENLQRIVEVSDDSVDTISAVLARREVQLNLAPVQLEQLIDKVLSLVDLRWFNITRKVEAKEATLDPTLMEHALLNLVSNARKFSSGGIGIGATRIRKAGTVDEEELELWVWNDGAVITAGDREEIFKPGKQTADGQKAGGHGLGLAIVKAIAERHHGRVTVESHEKKGTTFRIIIPVLSLKDSSSQSTGPLSRPEQPETILKTGIV